MLHLIRISAHKVKKTSQRPEVGLIGIFLINYKRVSMIIN